MTTREKLIQKLSKGAVTFRSLTVLEMNELKKLDVKVINGVVIANWEVWA
jgi:hypothetical protein